MAPATNMGSRIRATVLPAIIIDTSSLRRDIWPSE